MYFFREMHIFCGCALFASVKFSHNNPEELFEQNSWFCFHLLCRIDIIGCMPCHVIKSHRTVFCPSVRDVSRIYASVLIIKSSHAHVQGWTCAITYSCTLASFSIMCSANVSCLSLQSISCATKKSNYYS